MGAEKITKIVPIILAGGKGSRLWPISRKSFPKQFLNLFNEEYTLLQETYKRIENIGDLTNPLIICNEEHRFIVGHQMKAINIRPLSILLEPEGRNTTPAITIAALKALEIYKESVITKQFDFQGVLANAKSSGKNSSWRSLRDGDFDSNQDYQIIDKDNVLEFRKKVNEKLLSFIKENLPSLAESDKSLPPNDWIN